MTRQKRIIFLLQNATCTLLIPDFVEKEIMAMHYNHDHNLVDSIGLIPDYPMFGFHSSNEKENEELREFWACFTDYFNMFTKIVPPTHQQFVKWENYVVFYDIKVDIDYIESMLQNKLDHLNTSHIMH